MTKREEGTVGEQGRARSFREAGQTVNAADRKRTFVNEDGKKIRATMEEFNTRYVTEGFRPVDVGVFDTEDLDTPDETPH